MLAVLAVVALALAPVLAEARPGGGGSAGSRGSRTYSPPPTTQTAPTQARPVERSMTESTRMPVSSPAASRAGLPGAQQGSWMQRNPFMAGLLGGALGAGLIGLLMGGGLFGGLGGAGFAGVLGLMLQLALVAGLVMLALRLFRRRAEPQPAAAAPGGAYAREAYGAGDPQRPAYDIGGAAGVPAMAAPAITLDKADFDAFEASLKAVQAAWSNGDLRALGTLATPEMVQYLADDLATNASKGVRNEVSDVVLEAGDLSEAWHEMGRDYATVAMRFSLLDVTRRVSDGQVVDGDLALKTRVTELWTFLRAPGGAWLLSAIQQTA
jgi:predicted lipid-binding transport protein (Tim44 family)